MGLEKARESLADAEEAAGRILSAKDNQTIRKAWSDFLIYFNRTIGRVEGAANAHKSPQWWNQVKAQRKSDAFLQYAHHARNADEHGIAEITEPQPFEFKVGRPDETVYIEHFSMRDGVVNAKIHGGTVMAHSGSIVLIPVVDRGQTYRPPVPLAPRLYPTPAFVVENAMPMLRDIVSQAEKQPLKPV